jgi:hypothetical protein
MATYLDITNELLRELNEVPLTAANFSGAVGVQQLVKDKINLAYLDIVNAEPRWPFLAIQTDKTISSFSGNVTQDAVAGQRWYEINEAATNSATDYVNVDWDSFYATSAGVVGHTGPKIYKTLKYLPLHTWRDVLRDIENSDDDDAQTWGDPVAVIRSHDNRHFGLSPIPKQALNIRYFAYSQPTLLSSASDLLVFQDVYTTVLLSRARYYVWQFKQNYDAAMVADQSYKDGLRSMRENLLGSTREDMSDNRIRVV